jgi:hypothetical protein
MLLGEMIAVYSEYHTKTINTFHTYSASILFGHENARERAWPHRQSGESIIVSKQNASPV